MEPAKLNQPIDKKQIEIDPDEFYLLVKKLRFLDESNRTLGAVQEKIERLSCFHSDLVLSHDINYIIETGLAKFQELVQTQVCSLFLVDDTGFNFSHALSIPGELSFLIKKEVDAHIEAGSFGWAVSNGVPLCVPTETFGKENNRALSIMIAPLTTKHRTLGVVALVFEEDQDFIRQQVLKLLQILTGFFSISLENAFLFGDLKQSYFDTIRAIANSIEARDPYTRGHSERVAHLAKIIAQGLGWDKKEIDLIHWGGMLHDVGKIGISDSILNKISPLTDQEFEVIKSHPSLGIEIIKGIVFFDPVLPYVLDHHERFDGTGYPRSLSGQEISVKGRLLAVADAFDAMTTDRPYRKGLSPEHAFREIMKCAGAQFDPEILKIFENAWTSGKIIADKRSWISQIGSL